MKWPGNEWSSNSKAVGVFTGLAGAFVILFFLTEDVGFVLFTVWFGLCAYHYHRKDQRARAEAQLRA